MEVDDFLAHHGVKGMRWGKRKARPMVARYSKKAQVEDKAIYGSGGVRRINKRLASNPKMTVGAARRREIGRSVALAGGTALGAISLAVMYSTGKGPISAGKAVYNAVGKNHYRYGVRQWKDGYQYVKSTARVLPRIAGAIQA